MSTLNRHFLHYFQNNLAQLRKEIEAYPTDESLWTTADGISNSAGNLTYHLLGNLNHFIGAALGQTGYVRDRPLEFSIKGVSKTELISWLDATSAMLEKVLPTIENLEAPYPAGYFDTAETIDFQLLRLLAHFNYHFGQVNYHRRLLT
jgi:hypothetical protein